MSLVVFTITLFKAVQRQSAVDGNTPMSLLECSREISDVNNHEYTHGPSVRRRCIELVRPDPKHHHHESQMLMLTKVPLSSSFYLIRNPLFIRRPFLHKFPPELFRGLVIKWQLFFFRGTE